MASHTEDAGRIKLPNHTHPSDYMDVQPITYDPDFISQISSKMQVPDRISVGSSYSAAEEGMVHQDLQTATQFVGMTVPDRIILAVEERDRILEHSKMYSKTNKARAQDEKFPSYPDMKVPFRLVYDDSSPRRDLNGDNQHIGVRQDLDLNLSGSANAAEESLAYVSLITPPRVLTLEERFPVVEETDDHKILAAHGTRPSSGHRVTNGHIGGVTVPYDPGVNFRDPVLLNEEDESTLLRTQVAKLTRRVQVLEEENQKRSTRELVLYPLILGYFLLKVMGWLSRDK